MRPSSKGFTLPELLLAAAILAFVLTGILLLFINCMLLNAANRNLALATAHAEYIMEDIKGTDFTGLEARINDNNGTPTGWDFNAAQIQSLLSAPDKSTVLDTETISTTVSGSDPLEVLVVVGWLDRGAKNRNIELRTLITDY